MIKKFEEVVSVSPIGITMPLIDSIPDAEGLIAFAARVSNPSNQHNYATADKLLAYCARNKHWSIFDMCNLVLEIKAPRDITRQLLRHSSLKPQEFCIAGDSLVTMGNGSKVSIEKLFKRYLSKQYWEMSHNLVRVFDQSTQSFTQAKIKEVFSTGIKPVYEITLSNGRKIKSTKEHKFLLRDGFKELESIAVGDFIACNGVPVHQDINWLKAAKEESLQRNGLQYIADKAGVSYHTIRKWLKKHRLSFTKKEVSQYTDAWNKGLPTQEQPRFNKHTSVETRKLMRQNSRKGKDSNLYLNGNYSESKEPSWRKRVGLYCAGFKAELLHKQDFKCAISGENIDINTCEVAHIKPVCFYPELAFSADNLQLLSKASHRAKTSKERVGRHKTVKWAVVESIEYVGEVKTYDLEVDFVDHNYVANGIVTHNSQRYAEVDESMFCLRECRMQDTKNRQNSLECNEGDLEAWWRYTQEDQIYASIGRYQSALEQGIAKEVARVLLPEGNTMSCAYVNGTVRSWLHYIEVRKERGVTQKEHCILADMIESEFLKHFPSLAKQLNKE